MIAAIGHVVIQRANQILALPYNETQLSQVSPAGKLEILPDLRTQLQLLLQWA